MRPLRRNATLCQGEFLARSSRNSRSTSRGEAAATPSTPCGLAAAPRRVVADGASEVVKQSLAGKRQDLSSLQIWLPAEGLEPPTSDLQIIRGISADCVSN
jgi:hypothetical protein